MKQELIEAATELLNIANGMPDEGPEVKKILWVCDEMIFLSFSDLRQTLEKWYLNNAPVGYEISIKKIEPVKKAKTKPSASRLKTSALAGLLLAPVMLQLLV